MVICMSEHVCERESVSAALACMFERVSVRACVCVSLFVCVCVCVCPCVRLCVHA